MSSLIGVYETPNPERIERDDEARRTIAKAFGEGARIVGSFGCDADGQRAVAGEVARRAWDASGRGGTDNE